MTFPSLLILLFSTDRGKPGSHSPFQLRRPRPRAASKCACGYFLLRYSFFLLVLYFYATSPLLGARLRDSSAGSLCGESLFFGVRCEPAWRRRVAKRFSAVPPPAQLNCLIHGIGWCCTQAYCTPLSADTCLITHPQCAISVTHPPTRSM